MQECSLIFFFGMVTSSGIASGGYMRCDTPLPSHHELVSISSDGPHNPYFVGNIVNR